MSKIPADLYYTEAHDWVRIESDSTITLGITDHAQESMGDMVFVDLPEVGAKLNIGDECGVLESVKSATDFYAPVAGQVSAVNDQLADNPDLINKDPYNKGWVFKMQPTDIATIKDNLMNAKAYKEFLESE